MYTQHERHNEVTYPYLVEVSDVAIFMLIDEGRAILLQSGEGFRDVHNISVGDIVLHDTETLYESDLTLRPFNGLITLSNTAIE